MASWLVRSTPERAVRVRALPGLLSVFLGTLLSQCLSRPGVQMRTGKLLGETNKLRGSDLQWTRLPSREPLRATETGISSGSYESLMAQRLHFRYKS